MPLPTFMNSSTCDAAMDNELPYICVLKLTHVFLAQDITQDDSKGTEIALDSQKA